MGSVRSRRDSLDEACIILSVCLRITLLLDLAVDLFTELRWTVLVIIVILVTKRRSLIDGHDELSRVEDLQLETLVHNVILCRHVKHVEILVLLKLLEDDLLLRKLQLDVPDRVPVLPAEVDHLRVLLHGVVPGEGTGRVVTIALCKANDLTLGRLLYDVGLERIGIGVTADLNGAHYDDSDPVIGEHRLIFPI